MKKFLYENLKIILIFLIICCSLICSFFTYDSLAEFKFKDLQKKAADLNDDGKYNYKDMEILVDQNFPQRPKDGVKNQSGEGYLVDLFAQSKYVGSSSVAVSGDVIKVLMIGNSYTYYGNTGGILAELAHRAGYRIIVVNAIHPVYYGKELYTKHDLWQHIWDYSGNKLDAKEKKGKSLSQIAKENYGQGRAGKWDYVFLQDQKFQKSYDKKIFELFKNGGMLESSDRFIMNANISSSKKPNGKRKKGGKMTSFSKSLGCGIVYTGEIIGKSSVSWKNLKFLHDGNGEHPTVKAQYINACALYAKIYGKEKLANSKNPTSFIEAYNSHTGNYREFVKELCLKFSYKNYRRNVTRYRISVIKSEAIDFQYLVYRYYEQYVI